MTLVERRRGRLIAAGHRAGRPCWRPRRPRRPCPAPPPPHSGIHHRRSAARHPAAFRAAAPLRCRQAAGKGCTRRRAWNRRQPGTSSSPLGGLGRSGARTPSPIQRGAPFRDSPSASALRSGGHAPLPLTPLAMRTPTLREGGRIGGAGRRRDRPLPVYRAGQGTLDASAFGSQAGHTRLAPVISPQAPDPRPVHPSVSLSPCAGRVLRRPRRWRFGTGGRSLRKPYRNPALARRGIPPG
jgi:hypothetical protein